MWGICMDLFSLIGLLPRIESTLVHTDRFFEVYNITPYIRDEPQLAELNEVRGRIEFRDVSFAYQPERIVLNEINLEIGVDETVFFVCLKQSAQTVEFEGLGMTLCGKEVGGNFFIPPGLVKRVASCLKRILED